MTRPAPGAGTPTGLAGRLLDTIERVGNRLPDPAVGESGKQRAHGQQHGWPKQQLTAHATVVLDRLDVFAQTLAADTAVDDAKKRFPVVEARISKRIRSGFVANMAFDLVWLFQVNSLLLENREL